MQRRQGNTQWVSVYDFDEEAAREKTSILSFSGADKNWLEFVIENRFDRLDAIKLFYNSKIYETLSREETKLWHLSALTLYDLLDEELTTGHVNYPEEQ
jgi:hypothetical protein